MRKYVHMIGLSVFVLLSSLAVKAEEVSLPSNKQEAVQQDTHEEKEDQGTLIVQLALRYIGTPYVSGGNNLESGVDCSGFVQQVYKKFGIQLERNSRSQYAVNGTMIKKQDLQPGDLVFYGYSRVNHVAIYIGEGRIIHAPAPGQTVCTAPLWQRGDANIIGYKRVL